MTKLARDPRALTLLMTATMTVMSNATISPALPGLSALFRHTPHAELLTRLLVTAPSLLVALVAPLTGIAADRFGRRRQLLASIVLFAVAGSAGLYLPDLPSILVSRLILGIAVAAMMTAQTALVGDYFSGSLRGQFMSYQLATTNFGGFLFISMAGLLANESPRWPFGIYAIAILLFPFTYRIITEPRREPLPHPHSPAAPGSAPNAVTAAANWKPTVAIASAIAGTTFVTMYVLPTQLPFFLADVGHTAPTAAGQTMAALTLAGGAAAILQAQLGHVFPPARLPTLGSALMAAGFTMLSLGSALPTLMGGTALVGLGVGSVLPILMTKALDSAPIHKRGAIMGTITTSIYLGQFLSPLIAQPLIAAFTYRTTFQLIAAVLLCQAGVLWLWLRQPRAGLESTDSRAA